jgi:transcription initiation factor TFIID subunit 7
MKTLDNKTVYKVADVSQIIVCSPPDSKSKRESKIDEDGKSHANEWPNGLCPPMKSARQKCFRKTKRKKYMDAADVERELKRLLRFLLPLTG